MRNERNKNKACECEVVGVHAATGDDVGKRMALAWQPSWIGLENITCPRVRPVTAYMR